MSIASVARVFGFALPLLASLATPIAAQEVTLSEQFKPGHTTKIELKVKLTAKLALPAQEKDKQGRIVAIAGNSTLVFEERVLAPDEADTYKTVRMYREVAFEKTIDDVKLDAGIRPSVRRMVVLKPIEQKDSLPRPVPFSPDGPLTLGELEIVSIDIFNPTLVPGLLPPNAVKPGQSWKASAAAIGELTNLEKVEEGSVAVEFVGIVKPNGKELARLKIAGIVRGVDKDGPSRHKLEGTAYFDLNARLLTYVSMKATKELLDGKGQTGGIVEGQFTLTRTPVAKMPAELSDASLRDLDLKNTVENTLLLYDNPDLGIRFLHPRSWRVGTVQGKQITLDHLRGGGGIFITVEPSAKVPTADDYLKEVLEDLKKQKLTVTGTEKPTRVRAEPVTLDSFSVDVTIGMDKRHLDYTVLKQTDGGATIVANLHAEAAELRPEVVRIVRSLSVTKKIEEKEKK
jgi:hypothetical protein